MEHSILLPGEMFIFHQLATFTLTGWLEEKINKIIDLIL